MEFVANAEQSYQAGRDLFVQNSFHQRPQPILDARQVLLSWARALTRHATASVMIFDAGLSLLYTNNRFGTFAAPLPADLYDTADYISKHYKDSSKLVSAVEQSIDTKTCCNFELHNVGTGVRTRCTCEPVIYGQQVIGFIIIASRSKRCCEVNHIKQKGIST